MTRTIYYTATTLDGFLATEDHSLEWLFACDFDVEGPFSHERFAESVGALIMGRSTYDWLARHLASTGEPWSYTAPTWVFTHRPLTPIDGADVRAVSGDVAEIHTTIGEAAAGRDVWVVGGGDLAGRLAVAGLLDEIIVSIAPVTLGAGAPILPHPVRLRLEDTARNRDFLCARYAVLPPD